MVSTGADPRSRKTHLFPLGSLTWMRVASLSSSVDVYMSNTLITTQPHSDVLGSSTRWRSAALRNSLIGSTTESANFLLSGVVCDCRIEYSSRVTASFCSRGTQVNRLFSPPQRREDSQAATAVPSTPTQYAASHTTPQSTTNYVPHAPGPHTPSCAPSTTSPPGTWQWSS